MRLAFCFLYEISGFVYQGDKFADNSVAFFPFKTGIIGDCFFAVVVAAFDICNLAVFIIEYCNFGIYLEGNDASLFFCLCLCDSAGLCGGRGRRLSDRKSVV